MNNEFYILRHGETEYLTIKKHLIYPFKGSLNRIGLTKKGRKDVSLTAKQLEKEKIDVIYSSDFLRARQTSLIVNKLIKKEIFLSQKLRDFNLGSYHGKRKDKVIEEVRKCFKDFNRRVSQGESVKEAQKRIVDFLFKIDKKHKGKRILIVSHGEPLWLLEAFFNKKKEIIDKDFNKKDYIKAGEWRKLKK